MKRKLLKSVSRKPEFAMLDFVFAHVSRTRTGNAQVQFVK